MRQPKLLAIASLLVLTGCGSTEPVLLPTRGVELQQLETETGEPPPQTLDLRTVDSVSAQVAGAIVSTNPPLTSAGIGTPPPPPTLTGSEPTTPTTRSTAATTSTATPTTVPETVAPSTPAGAGIVEFRIPSGTQAGPWNSFENPVRVTVGQILRIHNDDAVAHTLHSNGTPFEHGPTIQPGQYADHPIVATLSPDPEAPANYEHDAGVSAPLWVVATSADANTDTTAADEGADAAAADRVAGPPDLVAAEAESLRLLNRLRVGLGAQPVAPEDQQMHAFAREWSLEMRNTGFRHSSPPLWFENIVWYSDQTMTPEEAAAQFHDMWVNSPATTRT